mmetsp:Transcript_34941/g.84528  ORF Transcript_34941/g.84528 Transcript_34941/m.84528 type:complete len:285 (-) Transcript_34941:129-983(-)
MVDVRDERLLDRRLQKRPKGADDANCGQVGGGNIVGGDPAGVVVYWTQSRAFVRTGYASDEQPLRTDDRFERLDPALQALGVFSAVVGSPVVATDTDAADAFTTASVAGGVVAAIAEDRSKRAIGQALLVVQHALQLPACALRRRFEHLPLHFHWTGERVTNEGLRVDYALSNTPHQSPRERYGSEWEPEHLHCHLPIELVVQPRIILWLGLISGAEPQRDVERDIRPSRRRSRKAGVVRRVRVEHLSSNHVDELRMCLLQGVEAFLLPERIVSRFPPLPPLLQ